MKAERPPVQFADLAKRSSASQLLFPGTTEHKLLLGEYRPWRKVRAIAHDLGIPAEDAWASVKMARSYGWRALSLVPSGADSPFGLCVGPHISRQLHRIDRATGGGGAFALGSERGAFSDPGSRDRLRIKTLMDEAAESSLIEGAATTRKDAVELLRSGREPTSIGEKMVVNNYVAMQTIKRVVDRPLSVEMLLRLQTILTKDTLAEPDEIGRLRVASEAVRVVDERTGEAIFTPPPAADLPERLARLCDFANAEHEDGDDFLHPIVKACILHFMIGYEHPFCDGNGRTARAVFYWFAIKSGYTIFEYTAISELIRKSYAGYPQAYLDSESDDNDLTYFVLYKLNVIIQALARLAEHIAEQEKKIQDSERLLKFAKDLNLRQRLLLEHALRKPLTVYTVKSHMNSNGITPVTARADLDDLVRRKFMVTSKRGKEVLYMLAPGFAQKLASKLAKG